MFRKTAFASLIALGAAAGAAQAADNGPQLVNCLVARPPWQLRR
jgi:hypothetical protein